MKCASDFRKIARDSLTDRWGVAVLAGLVASLLGGGGSSTFNFNFNFTGGGSTDTENAEHIITEFTNGLNTIFTEHLSVYLIGFLAFVSLVALVFSAAFFVLSSVISTGYAKFNLELLNRQEKPAIERLFSYFSHWKTLTIANLLRSVYIFLWSLLFIIPGIFATYSYAMTSYILAENPEISASEAIARSKEMMEGNRWRLFCLEISFFGWAMLCAFTCGIGFLWLTPYEQAAKAAFYREVSGTEYVLLPEEPVAIESAENPENI